MNGANAREAAVSLVAPTSDVETTVSVVIPTFNTRERLRDCLESLERSRAETSLELVVVDDASSDGSAEMVRRDYPRVQLVVLPVNRGYSGAVNAGLPLARGELVVVLNADTVVHEGALARLHAELTTRPDVGAGCPRGLHVDGTLQSCGSPLLGAWDLARRALLLRGRLPRQRDPELSTYVGSASGACLCLTRAGMNVLGGFDERLPLYYEEQDVARRLLRAGLRCYYVADARVTHAGGQSVRQLDRGKVWLAMHRSIAVVYRAHFPFPTSAALCSLSAFMMLPRLVKSGLDVLAGGERRKFGRRGLVIKWAALRAYLGYP